MSNTLALKVFVKPGLELHVLVLINHFKQEKHVLVTDFVQAVITILLHTRAI